MKKLLALLFAAFAAVALFAGCNNGNGGESGEGGAGAATVSADAVIYAECVAFTAKGDYIALTDTSSVYDYMCAMKEKGELSFSGSDSEYGFYIESVFALSAGSNSFWAVYTDLVTIDGDDFAYSNAEWGTYSVGGKTLYSASVGVSSLPCVEGYTYALVYSEF